MPKNTTTQKDLFYDLDDVINLFKTIPNDKYYKHYKIARTFPIWTGEYAAKLGFYPRYKKENNNKAG